jgi:hypothetical protein
MYEPAISILSIVQSRTVATDSLYPVRRYFDGNQKRKMCSSVLQLPGGGGQQVLQHSV